MIRLAELIDKPWHIQTAEMNYLFESPLRIGSWDVDNLATTANNLAFTRQIMDKCPNPATYKSLNIYEYTVGNINYAIFVKNDFTQAFFSYHVDKDNNFVEDKVWQEFTSLGLCRDILFDYYLNRFNGIISDATHSELGERYWKKIVDISIKNGYKAYAIFDNSNRPPTELTTVDDMDKYYGFGSVALNTRFLIKKI